MSSITIKEIKGRRLYRALRRLFGVRDFNFQWTDFHTAYWDGKTMFIKYDISHDKRTYTPAEAHIVRQGLAYHEMGHKLYDDLEVYSEWLKNNSSTNRADWVANEKWPPSIVRNLGNLSLDGRLEHSLKLDYPFTTASLDFVNEYWAFYAPTNEMDLTKYRQFLSLFARRVLQLADFYEYDDEVLALYDEHAEHIKNAIHAGSTKDCLEHTRLFLEAVYPQLLEWADENDEADKDVDSSPKDNHENTDWSHNDIDKDENNDRVQERIQNIEGELPDNDELDVKPEPISSLDLADLLAAAEREISQATQELEAFNSHGTEAEHVKTETSFGDVKVQGNVVVENWPANGLNIDYYEAHTNKLAVKGLEKALKAILQPVEPQVLRNSRNGKFRPHMAWKGLKCDNMQMFERRVEGRPQGEAYLSCMVDISGSTSCTLRKGHLVIDEVKQALSVILTASHNVQLPSKAYAFTSPPGQYYDTQIFRIKENEAKFSVADRASLGGLSALRGNNDITALQFLINDLKSRKEAVRIGIMISDGEPCFSAGESEEMLRDMVTKASKNGLDILCLFVGNDDYGYECARRMYGDKVIRSRSSLSVDLKKQFTKLLQARLH